MQQNQVQLLQILQTAYLSHDNQERNNAQQQLQQAINSDPNLFIETACTYLNQEQGDQTKKSIVLTALRSLLKTGQDSKWFQLNQQNQSLLKMTAFTQLIVPNENIMNMSAYLLSNIFVLNLTNVQETQETLDSIVNNVAHQEMNIKKAAILSLSTICELLSQEKITNLSEELVDKLLYGICTGLQEFSELTETSLKGLYYSIEFLKPKLQQESICDFIYDLLIKTLQEALNQQSEDNVYWALMTLMEISTHLYQNIGKYNQILQEKVYQCRTIQCKKVINAFQQFFIELLQLELIHHKKYFDISYEHLVQYCVQFFQTINEEDDFQDEQNSLFNSTQTFLKLLNTLYIEKTFGVLFGFVQQNFYQDTNKKAQSLLILHSLLIEETQNNSELQDFIKKIFSLLVNQMGQPNTDQTLNIIIFTFLSEAAKYQPQIFMDDQNFLRIIQKIICFFNSKRDADSLSHKTYCIDILTKLIESISENDKESIDKLNSYAQSIIDKIILDLNEETSLPQIDQGYNLIYLFLDKIIDSRYFTQFYKKFFAHLLNVNKFCKEKELYLFKCNVDYILLTYILGKVYSDNSSILSTITQEEFHSGFVFTDDLFKQYQEIQYEGLYFMSLIVHFETPQYSQHDFQILLNYTNHSLLDYKNEMLFTTGLESLNIMMNNHHDELTNLVNNKLEEFLNLTRNPDVNDKITLRLFNILQDIAFKYPEIVIQHLQTYITIVQQSLEAQIYFLRENTKPRPNVWEFIQQTVDLLQFIIQGIYVEPQFAQYDTQLEQFLINCTLCFEQICHNFSNELTLQFVSEVAVLQADFYKKKNNMDLMNKQRNQKQHKIF